MSEAVGAVRRRIQTPTPALTAAPIPWRLRSVLLWAFVFRLLISPWGGHGGDLNTFNAWAMHLAEVGPAKFWDGKYWCDYLPGYLYVLWALGKFLTLTDRFWILAPGTLAGNAWHFWVLKWPSMFADLATAWILWAAVRDIGRARGMGEEKSSRWAGALAAFYLFNPAVFVNSSIWGQVDSFHALGLVAGLALLMRRMPLRAALVLGLAAAIKPHTAVLLPLVLVYAVAIRLRVSQICGAGVLLICAFAATFIPFDSEPITHLPAFIRDRWLATMGQYTYATVNAMNLWYLLGQNWHTDGTRILHLMSMSGIGKSLTFAMMISSAAWAAVRVRREGAAPLWQAAAITYLGTFLFVTQAHERHVFPFFPMAIAGAALAPAALAPYALVSLMALANLAFAWRYMVPDQQYFHSATLCPPFLGALICIITLLALPLLWLSFTDSGESLRTRFFQWLRSVSASLPAARLDTCVIPPFMRPVESFLHARRWLALILLFALGLRLARLNSPPERFFDEVYHAYTAERWAQGDTAAWYWGSSAPDKDCAYEWTHPPLAKEIMWASLKIFGADPDTSTPLRLHAWVWRLPAALLGTACVALVYFIARELFRNERIGLYAAAFASLDVLPLVLSRIGMNDIYFVAFMLASVLAALRRRDVLTAICAGCALASKWTALFSFPLLLLVHFVWTVPEKRWNSSRWAIRAAAYAVIVPAIYLGSYIPFFRAGYTIQQFGQLQYQMWYYHTHLKATHAFSSPAYTWPVTYKYVWAHTHRYEPPAADTATAKPSSDAGVTVGNVYIMANPAIWLAGVAALALAAFCMVKSRSAALLIAVGGYLFFWAPWLISPRIMFLYHYLPSLFFLYLALGWGVAQLDKGGSSARFILGLSFIVLLVLYPYATAVRMPLYLTPGNWFFLPGLNRLLQHVGLHV